MPRRVGDIGDLLVTFSGTAWIGLGLVACGVVYILVVSLEVVGISVAGRGGGQGPPALTPISIGPPVPPPPGEVRDISCPSPSQLGGESLSPPPPIAAFWWLWGIPPPLGTGFVSSGVLSQIRCAQAAFVSAVCASLILREYS
jgi:hypothetical protein